MKLIETFVEGKRGEPTLSEDGWVETADFVAVVDGSTSKVEGRNGGRKAMEIVCGALRTLSAEADKTEMLQHLTAALAAHNIPEAAARAEYRLTCSAVIFSRHRRVVWLVGDCQCRFGGQTHTHPKLVDEVLTQARADALRYLLAHGHTEEELRRNDLGRAMIADALREQTNFQNDANRYNPYRYPVLDGTPVDPSQVPEIDVPIYIKECVLASDGYPELFDTWKETEERLQQLLLADPLCIGPNAATKAHMEGFRSFDDRAFVRFTV